jgi:ubiquinone/menaquinone biosynthesis C-methylase UbiE
MFYFSDPHKNIEQCTIQPGQLIADFGSGSGFYSIEAAKMLAATGTVFAIDVQKDLLVKLKNTANAQGLYNIEVVWGDIEKENGTHIKDNSIDLVLICNILFQLENKKTVIAEAKRILAPGARMLVIDWKESFGGIGPSQEHVFSQIDAQTMCTEMGFAQEREIDAGLHHYGMIYKKL